MSATLPPRKIVFADIAIYMYATFPLAIIGEVGHPISATGTLVSHAQTWPCYALWTFCVPMESSVRNIVALRGFLRLAATFDSTLLDSVQTT